MVGLGVGLAVVGLGVGLAVVGFGVVDVVSATVLHDATA